MKPSISAFLLLCLVLPGALTLSSDAVPLVLPGSNQGIEESWKAQWLRDGNASPEHLNRLVLSDSAYLKQHADNPIDWYPWTDEAFARAIKENKLIFLSIGYASCHWCHVMESESFADPEVATVLNKLFVSIKVDREQHPDIDAYYNLVVETIKGESGWPVTLVLLPDLSPVLAANYLDKKSLLTAISRLGKFWQEQPQALEQNASLLSAEVEKRSRLRGESKASADKQWVAQAKQRLLADIDTSYGGFGGANKFPGELKLQFLLDRFKQEQTDELRDVLLKQLDAIIHGGLNDVVNGGIFRYTTDRQMSRPHFEKMLYNQALTVHLFADAAKWLEKPEYADFANSIVNFAKTWLRLPNGAYAAAIDADHEGREGGYYLWPESILNDIPQGIEQVAFTEGLYFLYGDPGSGPSEPWQARLQQTRKAGPRVIGNQVTAWNALWISALLKSGDITEAESLAQTLWADSWSRGRLYRLGSQAGFLDDYSYLSNALWQLYLKTGDGKWKERARILDRKILDLFYIDGNLSYRSRDMQGQFPVDMYQDKELPSPLAMALRSFSHHQTELAFVEAYEAITAAANAAIGGRPEYYLSLVQTGGESWPASEHIIAKGHGMISMKEGIEPGRWRVIIDLDDDWHVNAAEVFDKNLVATRITGEGVTGVEYPDGFHLQTEFSDEVLNVYSGRTEIDLSIPQQERYPKLLVRLQACSINLCLLPENVHLNATSSAYIAEN